MCLVSSPTSTRSCFLFNPNAKRDNFLSGPCINILACLQSSADCHSLRCTLSAHDRTSVRTSGGSRISVRGMRRGSGPQFFSEGMTPTFYGRLLAHIGVARIFIGCAPRGASRISGWGDDGGARPRARRGRREAPERREGGIWGGAP